MQELAQLVGTTVKDVFGQDMAIVLTRPDEQFGDASTNVALQLAGKLGLKPRDVAEQIVTALRDALGDNVKEITIAGPGFINIVLSDNELAGLAAVAAHQKPQAYADKVVVTEYSDPNPFKALHAGHLYTTITGDAISKLIQTAAGQVHRVNFGGDVGLHVGKAMWAITKDGEDQALAEVESLAQKPLHDRATWMADHYVVGHNAYESETAKQQIVETNKKVYQLHEQNDHASTFAKIYWICRGWSYDYFDEFYKEIGVDSFEKYYPESSTTPIGLKTVKEQLARGVYKESDGAVVFDGEKYGLHTRVFINGQGLPTYEAKDVGLIMAKWQDYHFDQSVIITGNDIIEYMKVVLKSIEQFAPELPPRTIHLTHGMLRLEGGVKMSSRKGNVLFAHDILQAAAVAAAEVVSSDDAARTEIAAVKYAFLKQRMGGDIIYNAQESVALEGNSGPYLQYAHARARSILAKIKPHEDLEQIGLQPLERSLARKIGEYPEVLEKAVAELMPHHICTYLYELAQTFNRFYEKNRVVGDEREALRARLVSNYADVLQDGLGLLGIAAPDRL